MTTTISYFNLKCKELFNRTRGDPCYLHTNYWYWLLFKVEFYQLICWYFPL